MLEAGRKAASLYMDEPDNPEDEAEDVFLAMLAGFASNGSARIPGDGRLERAHKVIKDGVSVSPNLWKTLQSLT